MHLGYRWFAGLSLDDKIPDHSTFSKNKHNRFKEGGIFQDIFDEIVKRCIDKCLVNAAHLNVDGSLLKANASIGSMESIVTKMSTTEYADIYHPKLSRQLFLYSYSLFDLLSYAAFRLV